MHDKAIQNHVSMKKLNGSIINRYVSDKIYFIQR